MNNKSIYYKKYYSLNKKKILEKKRNDYSLNKEDKIKKVIEYKKDKYKDNKEEQLLLARRYYYLNQKKILEKKKIHYLLNKKDKIKKVMQYQKEKYKTDQNFKIKVRLKARTLKALKGINKSNTTMKLLGLNNLESLWNHLEKNFKQGMTRENHGKWHIDHIIPCSSFNLSKPDEQAKCFHYTNLQPLWAYENLSKGSKIFK